jgi:hypothetical protein
MSSLILILAAASAVGAQQGPIDDSPDNWWAIRDYTLERSAPVA